MTRPAEYSAYVVDTHALIWFLQGDPRLGEDCKTILLNPHSRLILPAIVLAEACWIVALGRTNIPSERDLLAAINADPRVEVAPLDRNTVEKTLGLTAIGEMHDRQIVAAALMLQDAGATVALLSRDANIRDSGLVPVIW